MQKRWGNLPEVPRWERGGVAPGIQICPTGKPCLFCSDGNDCSGRWRLFIYILIRYFHFTPFWGKSGTLISEDMCIWHRFFRKISCIWDNVPCEVGAELSLRQPCHEAQMRSQVRNAWLRGGSRHSSFHGYVVSSGPRTVSYLDLYRYWGKLASKLRF